MTATDEDFGDNARIAYKLAGDDAHVEIDNEKGILRVRNQFDRETNEIYRYGYFSEYSMVFYIVECKRKFTCADPEGFIEAVEFF